MSSDDQSGFYLDSWWVSPAEGRITQGEESLHLEPKVMEVLVYLAARPGKVVTREQLERDVWHGGIVGYDAVTGTVIKLRKALQDSARHPRLIATVPKRGYELIGPIRRVHAREAAPAAAPENDTAQHRAPSRSPPRRAAALGAAAVLVLLVGVGVWAMLRSSPGLRPGDGVIADLPSIAVLPFENLSDDPRHENLADGVTEDLITDLSGSSRLMVIASNSSFTYKSRVVSPQDVAKDLHVQFVLQGSIRPVADRIRVNAQLVDGRTGFNRWAARYDGTKDEIFAIQQQIVTRLVAVLEVTLTSREKQRLAKRTTLSFQAYDLFQQGQAVSKLQTREAQEEAAALYQQAIKVDPSYGRAYGALGYILATAYRRGWTDTPAETADRALAMAKKGVELNDSIPQTYWSLGYVHLFRQEYELAKLAAERSVEIAPNYADGYGLLALIHNSQGHPAVAIDLITKGMRLNPYYTWDFPFHLGWAYYTLGRYDDAIRVLEEAQQRNPNAVVIKLFLTACYVRAGRQDDAEWLASETEVLNPSETIGQMEKTLMMEDPEQRRAFLQDLRTAGLRD